MSNNSSTKEIFDIAKPLYEEALRNQGYTNVELNFIPKEKIHKPKKSNAKKIIYCNLPWNVAVKSNIGKEFLSLIDTFKNSLQGKYINRHSIKLSYSTMKNLGSHIAASNLKKVKQNPVKTTENTCKCENQQMQCPVNGQCMTDNVVYEAQVKTRYTTKSYIGMTGRPFFERWKEHRGNLKHKHQKGTKLSNFIWKQKESGEHIDIQNIKWSLKAKAMPYQPGARFCDTCLCEKTHIALSNPQDILNTRKEIVSKCPHKREFKLKYFKPP